MLSNRLQQICTQKNKNKTNNNMNNKYLHGHMKGVMIQSQIISWYHEGCGDSITIIWSHMKDVMIPSQIFGVT